jgi:hypothetical protein
MLHELQAHHKGVPHGNAGGNNKDAPEIDGGGLPLALLLVFCVALLFRKIRS